MTAAMLASSDAQQILRDNLREIMGAQGLGQAQLAAMSGLSHRSITGVLSEGEQQHAPTLDTLQSIAAALGTSVAELLTQCKAEPQHHLSAYSSLLARQLSRLIEDYLACSAEGRKTILAICAEQVDAWPNKSEAQ